MEMLSFFATSELLKCTRRKGWVIRGIEEPESVADHMYQMSLICLAYPWISEDERAKAVEMALVHDAPEALAGDITPSDGVSREAKHAREELGLNFLRCLARQGNNEPLAGRIKSLWDEYEDGVTHVSKVVHQVDKLEALQQAYLYTIRYPTHDLSDFKSHRGQIIDPWLARQADEILRRWDALDLRTKSSLIMVFVIGGPGVGKGTQCALAAAQFGLEHVSVGELLREEESSPESPFKDFIRDSIRQSVVVPAALTMMLLEKKIQSAQERGKAGVLVDGFPRSSDQLRAFQEQITSRFATIVMDCPDDVLSQRLSLRAGTSKREDDEEHIIQRRLQTFRESQEKIIEALSRNWLRRIECHGSVHDVQVLFQVALQDIIRDGTN